jgi:hypothetical protein
MRTRLLCLAPFVVLLAGMTWLAADPPGRVDPLEESLKKARVDGKYRMLLRQIKAPEDEKEHGAFKDVGYQARSEYGGQKNLPAAHWVYVAPYWYLWRDLTANQRAKRQWGPEQAAGPPDTWPLSGDVITAWASLGEDDQDEWLLLEYAEPVRPQAILVYATYNPGAVSRVSVFKLDGEEVEVWKGIDPTPVGSAKGISVIPFRVPFKTNRVKIELRSKEVSGWNEIDAVGLRAGGKIQWATAVEASSTYATVAMPQSVPVIDVDGPRLDKLEKDVRDLKDRLKKLEERIKKRKSR